MLHFRLHSGDTPQPDFHQVFLDRIEEADDFYSFAPLSLSDDARMVQRQAFAGLLWSKQFYHYVVEEWLKGDPAMPPPPPERLLGRNRTWVHVYNDDVLSMPDKWEYPWFAAWDLAFHTIPLAMVDPDFAKQQLSLLLREWYQSPNGQLPAYEWEFSDVNPPVHPWACWRVYKIDGKLTGKPDPEFLESAFHKLLMNFTWWVNRKDSQGNNIFEGGFLGLDNIGVFDRSKPLPTGGFIEQADGTAWMGMYCLTMLRIAIELTPHDRSYEDIASKFFEHFLYIASAMNRLGGGGLWDEEDGFFYDRLRMPDGRRDPDAAAIAGGVDTAVRGDYAGRRGHRQDAGLQAAHDVVHQASRGPVHQYRIHHAARPGRAHAAFSGAAFAAAARAANHAGRERVPLAAWHPRHFALSQGPSVRLASGRPGIQRGL